eukprot:symbB.v1.2.030448.t1/scaffold3429.1/size56941/4
MVEEVMVQRIDEVVQLARDDDWFITRMVRIALEHTPRDLLWRQVGPSPCFHGNDAHSGHLYSINFLTGVVLLNGCQPRRLPSTIVEHDLFRRSFGDISFEVSLMDGSFKTARAIDGSFYEFEELSAGELRIAELVESPSGQNRSLRLLPAKCLEERFPKRLVELFSHWLERVNEEDVILFRPIHFREKAISFVHFLEDEICLQIPEHLAEHPVAELLNDEKVNVQVKDQLVHVEGQVIQMLQKLEDEPFIHAFVVYGSGQPVLKRLELPRVNMVFEWEEEGWVSRDYRGYRLAKMQKLKDTLIDFDQYLVLERINANDLCLPEYKIILKDADVEGGIPLVLRSDHRSNTQFDTVCFDVHQRFGHLQAESIHSRLFLASLYAGTDGDVPDPRLGVTGMEAAVELLRQSWVNRPLTDGELRRLLGILPFASRPPWTLDLLCRELLRSSFQLAVLHGVPAKYQEEWSHENESLVNAGYMKEARTNGCSSQEPNARRLLTTQEELRCLGQRSGSREVDRPKYTVEVEDCPVDSEYVESAEAELAQYYTKKILPEHPPPYPLYNSPTSLSTIGEEMEKEPAHHREPDFELTEDGQKVETWQEKLEKTRACRKQMEDFIVAALQRFPADEGASMSAMFQMRQISNMAPKVTPRDLLPVAWNPKSLRHFNPFLSPEAEMKLHAFVLLLLKLYVLEEKFKRLVAHANTAAHALLLQELLVTRSWSVEEHPQWLVFEVEECLQIRPVQYQVAKKLLDDPGAVVQLNMGEGKTRVILPMLILHWAGSQRDEQRLLRITALSSLISELFHFMHRHLCASVLRRRIFMLPFHRDVQLSSQDVQKMIGSLDFCRRAGGVLLVAPEDRLSLRLKWHELRSQGEDDLCLLLKELFDVSSRDLLDESDELLRHKYHLIYAVGNQMPLPEGDDRWNSATALLRVVHCSERLEDLLWSNPKIALRERRSCEAFDHLRLIPGAELEQTMTRLRLAMAEALMEDPPYELAWLKNYKPGASDYRALINFLTDPEQEDSILPDELLEERKTMILALRGFLAFSVLQHCLEKRHSVEYGIRRSHGKRLAVPYRASNTPSERSEFKHPDCAIVLTLLSYFDDGLSFDELKQAFAALLKCDQSVQEDRYRIWFQLSRNRMEEEHQLSLQRVSMIDLSNEQQLLSLHEYFGMNFETIAFWVCHCIFPHETSQYPQKLVATGWDLVDNAEGLVGGFSGTNDNAMALPLQVQQKSLDALRGTNGKMVKLILDNPEIHFLHEDDKAKWMKVVDQASSSHARSRGVRALIDCGALTAGATNMEIAKRLLEGLEGTGDDIHGVIYFDPERKDWMILDHHGRCLPKQSSPVREQECFGFFDEARARGADLKLSINARAMVTVGPKCVKDKLMQAVGRMRQLGKGQTLEFLASEEVKKKIQEQSCVGSRPFFQGGEEVPEISSRQLLEWVMANTVKAAEEALQEWAKQGLHFSMTHNNPELANVDEKVDLNSFYKDALVPRKFSEVFEKEVQLSLEKADGRLYDCDLDLITKIQDHVKEYGPELSVKANALNEECEREIELEKEVEEELEKEVLQMTPRQEHDWDTSLLWRASCIGDLPVEVMSLAKICQSTDILKEIDPWPEAKIFCTRNFHLTIKEEVNMDDYLRPVDAIMVLGNGELLLVSDREADALLQEFWTQKSNVSEVEMGKSNTLVNFALWRKDFAVLARKGIVGLLPSDVPESLQDVKNLVSLQAFMGNTSFETDAQKGSLMEMVNCMDSNGESSAVALKRLVNVRGMSHRYERRIWASGQDECCFSFTGVHD